MLNGTQPEDNGSASKPQLIRIGKATADDSDNKVANRRNKDVELSVPVVHGTIAFYLGRKASENACLLECERKQK